MSTITVVRQRGTLPPEIERFDNAALQILDRVFLIYQQHARRYIPFSANHEIILEDD